MRAENWKKNLKIYIFISNLFSWTEFGTLPDVAIALLQWHRPIFHLDHSVWYFVILEFIPDFFHLFFSAINYNFVRRVGQKYFVSNKERDYFSRATEFCSQQGLELPLPQNEEESNVLIISDVNNKKNQRGILRLIGKTDLWTLPNVEKGSQTHPSRILAVPCCQKMVSFVSYRNASYPLQVFSCIVSYKMSVFSFN